MAFEVYFREPIDGSVLKVKTFEKVTFREAYFMVAQEKGREKPWYIPIWAIQFWREI